MSTSNTPNAPVNNAPAAAPAAPKSLSGYQSYVKANYASVRHLPNNERMKALGQSWKQQKASSAAKPPSR